MDPSSLSRRHALASLCLLPAWARAAESAPAAPVYRTNVPRSFAFQYQIQRSGIRGSAELSWARTGASYEARLRGTVAGFTVLDWASSGGFDAAGVAPARFVEHRVTKSDRSATFRRSDSRIVFSGSRGHELPLVPGAQDRLSWLVQLPAILAADPALARAGSRVTMFVVGTHGRSGEWTFESAGRETIRTPLRTVHAVKWTRATRKDDDALAEVWLDAERQHLPARMRLTVPAFDGPLEMTLADAGP